MIRATIGKRLTEQHLESVFPSLEDQHLAMTELLNLKAELKSLQNQLLTTQTELTALSRYGSELTTWDREDCQRRITSIETLINSTDSKINQLKQRVIQAILEQNKHTIGDKTDA